MKRSALLSIIIAALALLLFPISARANCTSPADVEGKWIYNTDHHVLQYCNGVDWIPAGGVGLPAGGAGCTSPAGVETQVIYNQDYHTYQFCNGTNWVTFGQSSGGGGAGYFVMSKTTWTGNLGDISGADAKCLTDLTTNTGWMGYASASSRGMLNSSYVHAFICGHSIAGVHQCNNLPPSTTYFFADASNAAHGGAQFASDATGAGPNDWQTGATPRISAAHIACGQADILAQAPLGPLIFGELVPNAVPAPLWDTGTNAQNGSYGSSAFTDFGRWWYWPATTCDTQKHLICYVNPSNGACSNPTGSENQLTYNKDYHTYQYCNGTTWVRVGNCDPAALTWLPETAAEANSWNSVTYGNGLFVAVANSGTHQAMTSPDGVTWTARRLATNNWRGSPTATACSSQCRRAVVLR